jgi:hypothetical protein
MERLIPNKFCAFNIGWRIRLTGSPAIESEAFTDGLLKQQAAGRCCGYFMDFQ